MDEGGSQRRDGPGVTGFDIRQQLDQGVSRVLVYHSFLKGE